MFGMILFENRLSLAALSLLRDGPSPQSSKSEDESVVTDVQLLISTITLPLLLFPCLLWLSVGSKGCCEASGTCPLRFVAESLLCPSNGPISEGPVLPRGAAGGKVLAASVINGNCGPPVLLSLVVVLFLLFGFLRLAEVIWGFDGIARLLSLFLSTVFGRFGSVLATEVPPCVPLFPTISLGVGRRSSSQSTSWGLCLGGLGFVNFNRTIFDSEVWGGGAFGFSRTGPVRPYSEVAGSLIVGLLPVSGLIGADGP